jgi:hypothetical protein
MTGIAEVRQHLDALEAVQRRLGAIVTRTDPERAKDLVQGRRDLANQLHQLMADGDALLTAAGDAELKAEFRSRLTRMRSAAAALQAEWPAVRVRDTAGGDYRAAVTAVRASDQACIAWTRQMLDRLEAAGRNKE